MNLSSEELGAHLRTAESLREAVRADPQYGGFISKVWKAHQDYYNERYDGQTSDMNLYYRK